MKNVYPTYYIQRRGQCYLETVDECPTRKEALTYLNEYQFGDPSAEYYISSRPCKAWKDAGRTPALPSPRNAGL